MNTNDTATTDAEVSEEKTGAQAGTGEPANTPEVEQEVVATDETASDAGDESEAAIEAAEEEAPVAVDQPAVESEAVVETVEEEAPVAADQSAGAEDDQPSDHDLFMAALNGEMESSDDFMMTPVRRGQIIVGVIASKTDSEVLVDVGAKSEGIIGGREFENLDQETRDSLRVGDDISVYVLNPEDRNGHIQLSLRLALEEQDWHNAEAYMQSRQTYESSIAGYNKGGLIVRFGKVRGFVPASQISRDRRARSDGQSPDERWSKMVGEDILIKVIEVDRSRNRLILSERAADRERRNVMREELMLKLEVGQVYTGRVTRLVEFGAFVDIGGMDGLIHLSELDWKPVAHPREVLRNGQEIEVEVIHVDIERRRVGLSRKRRLADPWDSVAANYGEGQLVQGTITKMTKFGAFARLTIAPEIEGLIHISELADHRVGHPRDVVAEGQSLTLRIIRIDTERRRMGLSLKQVDSEKFAEDDWQSVIQSMNEEEEEGTQAAVEAEVPAASVEVEAEEEVIAGVEVDAEAVAEVEAEAEAVADVEAEAETEAETEED